jgi:transposase
MRKAVECPTLRLIKTERVTPVPKLPVSAFTRWDEKAGLRGMRYAPKVRRAQGTKKETGYEKTSTVRVNGNMIFKGHKLTIGLDLGDRWSCYCVLDEAGEVLLEQKLPTTPEAMKQTLERIPRSLMALETRTHSPWVSRLFRELGHEVLVAHAQKVQLISKSNRKDDRHDARTLARPSFHRKTGAKVDYPVAAPTESSTPNLHRATIAQQRARMEGWRQRRLGSMGTIWKKKK